MALPMQSERREQGRTSATSKKKAASKVASGRRAKSIVLRGTKERTRGGLRKEDLMLNKRGKAVSKKKSALGRRRYCNVEQWVGSVMEARRVLHLKGFVAINGRTLLGKSLYARAKALYTSSSSSASASAARVSSAEGAATGTPR